MYKTLGLVLHFGKSSQGFYLCLKLSLRLQILLEPAHDLFHALDAVLGLTGTGQFMGLVVEQHHAGLAAIHLKGIEHGNALRHPAAVVAVGVDEQGGGHALVSVFQWRVFP